MENFKIVNQVMQHLALGSDGFKTALIKLLLKFESKDFEKQIKQIIYFMAQDDPIWGMCKIKLVDPLAINWKKKKATSASITLPPENIMIPYDPRKPFILDISEFYSKTYRELMIHVQNTYGKTHYLPGFELSYFYANNPDLVPAELKDDDIYFLPGSSICTLLGEFCVPSGRWHNSQWGTSWYLANVSNTFKKVVLFERTNNPSIS